MSTSTRRGPRDPFQTVRQSFARWRSARTPGERIPESLWQAAVDAAREQGISKAAVALGLNHSVLKARTEATSKQDRPATFVPVGSLPFPVGADCVIEVEDGEGARMRVELRGAAASQAEPLARLLWGTHA